MRGEHIRAGIYEDFGAGSSPHARGAHAVMRVSDVSAGIIPACAGSTVFVVMRPS